MPNWVTYALVGLGGSLIGGGIVRIAYAEEIKYGKIAVAAVKAEMEAEAKATGQTQKSNLNVA